MIQPMFFLSFLSSYSSFASLNFHSKEVLGTFSILYISLVIDVLHASELRKATLQKQVGCFNHRVVALVADKLERLWLLEVCFGVED